MSTVADLLLQKADSDDTAFLFGGRQWSYRELVEEARARSALWADLRDDGRPPHIGVLLENVPDHLFWIAAAALSGAVVVGINSTYRGAQLAQLIDHTDCHVIVTADNLAPLLIDARSSVPPDRVMNVDSAEYGERLESSNHNTAAGTVLEDDLFLLIFTSGSTGLPKAVRCTHGRFTRTGAHVARVTELATGDIVYAPLPFFHTSALFTGWASALTAGVPIATRPRFSASNTIREIAEIGATVLTYTGKVLNYILAVPEQPGDADTRLRLAIGNEASERDIAEFSRRFGCIVRDSYGSTEGLIVIRRDPAMPPGSLGTADDTVIVADPETGLECPPADLGPDGELRNAEAAVGELVETAPADRFEGYYNNATANQSRLRDGWYWSGDLAYRTADGWLFFAGRSNEWLRVDGENFAAAPVEAIVSRFSGVRSVAVYAVPDDPVGDRVMAALELNAGTTFDPAAFDEFLAGQADLGPKWVPAFVRVAEELPKLASMKLDKTRLRREAWNAPSTFWRPERGAALRVLNDDDAREIDHLLAPASQPR